jgi:cytidylate kinase
MPADRAQRPVVIAVDGPAGSGKGTLAQRIAGHFGYAHLDTGLLYRAVGIALLRSGGDFTDEDAAAAVARDLSPGLLDDPALRTDEAADAASKVAVMPAVRAALVAFQRCFDVPAGRDGRCSPRRSRHRNRDMPRRGLQDLRRSDTGSTSIQKG